MVQPDKKRKPLKISGFGGVVLRRVSAAILILLFLLLFTMASGWFVHTTSQTLLRELHKIEVLCEQGNFFEAGLSIQALTCYYHSREHFLALFVRRDYLNSVAVSLSGLSAYAAEENLRDLKSEIGKAQAQISTTEHLFFSML